MESLSFATDSLQIFFNSGDHAAINKILLFNDHKKAEALVKETILTTSSDFIERNWRKCPEDRKEWENKLNEAKEEDTLDAISDVVQGLVKEAYDSMLEWFIQKLN